MCRPATPGQPVIAEAECYRITRSVAFTRAFAHHGDPKDPIAAAAGTFMLGTKGEVTRPQAIGTEVTVMSRAPLEARWPRCANRATSPGSPRRSPTRAGCVSRRRTALASF